MSEESENSIIKTNAYAYTADEQVQMWREAMVRWVDYIFVVYVWGGAFACIVWVLLLSRAPISICGVMFAVLFSLPLVFGIAYPSLRTRGIRRQRAALEVMGKLVTQWHEFDGRFITTHLSDGQEHRIELKDFMCYVVTNGILYLYIARKNYLAIPLRAFNTGDDRQAVFAMLKTNGVALKRNHPKGGWK